MSEKSKSRSRTTLIASGVIGALALAMSLALLVVSLSSSKAASFDPPFDLLDQDGRPFTNAALAGRPHALFFGFTSCPDICPTTLSSLSRWIDDAKISKTRFIFVTVDPERDTSEVLKKYLSAFSSRIQGLTGPPEKVSELLDAYHIFRQRVTEADGSYTMNHTASIFLIDPNGNFQDVIAYQESAASAVAKLKRLESAK